MLGIRFGFLARLLFLFIAYVVTAQIGLSLDAVSGFATLVWPPTGIALAAMILLGYRYWPAIAAGAFLVNLVTGASLSVALGIALGNTLEAVIGAYFLHRFGFDASLERLKDVLGLIFFAGVISTAVSATIGVTSLLLGGVVPSNQYGETWLAWWIGDMLGALVVAPLLLVWSRRLRLRLNLRQVFAVVAPFSLLVGACVFVFYGLSWLGVKALIFAYIIFPFLIWIALRFGQWGCVTATFVVSLVAIWGTVMAHGAGDAAGLSHALLLLQSFVGITAVTFMIMAAVVSEREKTRRKEQQLSQRALLLARQRARLEALNKIKDDFISIASHQLRTPATAVKQYLGMLIGGFAGRLNKQQQSYAQISYESNERQLRIINDLLRVASLDANRINLKKTSCNVTRLMADIVMRQSKEFEKRNVQLLFAAAKKPVKVHADEEFLRMVLENIIDNAGKYTLPGGKVSISLTQTNGFVQIHISDTGIGIAKKDQAKLFHKFSRLDNALTSTTAGTGLGLYWAKKVVDLHGGAIKLRSAINKGSTFIVELPKRAK